MPYSIIILLFVILLFPAAVHAEDCGEITGLWLTKKKDVAVRLEHCGNDGLCGHIAWLSPEESAANPALCGTKVLWNMRSKKGDPSEWTGGTLYKADEHKFYRADLRLTDANTLALRAYIGVPLFGKTKKLTRTTEAMHPPCALPAEKPDL